jgi:hypothetical protein
MNNPYDLHSWSKHYREEVSPEVSRRHLAKELRATHKPRGLRGHLGSALSKVLASLGAIPEPNDPLAAEPVK